MKLHCPHCGVKGSADDSYVGRKVKCPKCQGVFDVLADMASGPPVDASFPATLSPLPAEIPPSVPEVAIPVAAEDDLVETEIETMTVADASLGGEEAEAFNERSEDVTELEKPVDDFDLMEEFPTLDAVHAESPVEQRDNDRKETPVAESSEEGMLEDGVNRKETADPGQEQVPNAALNSERPSDGGKELTNDPTGGHDDEKSVGKIIRQAWAKARDGLAKWFGK